MKPSRVFVVDPAEVADTASCGFESWNLIAAVKQFVSDLTAQCWHDDEIPELARRVCLASMYLDRVINGGHASYFLDVRPDVSMANSTRAALRECGAVPQADLYDGAIATLVRSLHELDDLDFESCVRDVTDELDRLDTEFYLLPPEGDFIELGPKWLRAHPDLEFVDRETYRTRLDELARCVPDLETRKKQFGV